MPLGLIRWQPHRIDEWIISPLRTGQGKLCPVFLRIIMLSESQITSLQRRLERIAVRHRRDVNSFWFIEGRWAANRVNASLLNELRKKAGRPGTLAIVSGSPMLDSARNRMRRLEPRLLDVVNRFVDETYVATRIAHGLNVTKAGLKEAETTLVGGNMPMTSRQWVREFMIQWLGALQDLTVTASRDGKDINESMNVAERNMKDQAGLLAKKFNSVLLSAGGVPMRVAIQEN
jgi:hypothetical protein